MQKGRVHVQPPSFPVLTGSPVAGMAYLDRPSPAGYFIFPDLSVRHEGLYRLAFSLFEELKESKDADVEPPEGSPNTRDKLLSSNPMAPRAHVHFRLEVKSTPFAVFSAKKFPGLSESTPLSRTVAEQGCRVRIRRDVRMRRRDKASDGYQDFDDENAAYPHSEHYGTPQQAPDRPRSISHGSMDAQTPYSVGRRPSYPDFNYFPPPQNGQQANYQQPPPPAPVQSTTSYGPHLSFGGANAQYATPTFPLPQVPQPPQNNVQTNNGYYNVPHLHNRQMSVPQGYGYQPPQPQPPSYTNYLQPQVTGDASNYRPMSGDQRVGANVAMNHQPNMPQNISPYVQNHPALQQGYFAQQPHSGSRTPTPTNANGHLPQQLPPLRTDNLDSQIAIEQKYESKQEPRSPASAMQRPIAPSPSYTSSYNPFNYAGPPASSNPMSARNNAKRAFGEVFDNRSVQQPMYSGMRPSSADQGKDRVQIETDTGELEDVYSDDFSVKTLIYKRADGSQHAKKCPSPIDVNGLAASALL